MAVKVGRRWGRVHHGTWPHLRGRLCVEDRGARSAKREPRPREAAALSSARSGRWTGLLNDRSSFPLLLFPLDQRQAVYAHQGIESLDRVFLREGCGRHRIGPLGTKAEQREFRLSLEFAAIVARDAAVAHSEGEIHVVLSEKWGDSRPPVQFHM